MEALECIKTRRGLRVLPARRIGCGGNDLRHLLASDCMMDFAYNQKTASHAPALVILTTITGRSGFERDGSFSTSKGTHWQSFDAGIAAEAFCLAAHAHGLGTVIMGVFEESEVRKVIELPEGEEVAAIIAIGHPAEQPQAPARKDVDTLLRVID